MVSQLDDTRRQVAIANRILSDVGLATGVTAALGHASMRVPDHPDRFVVTGRRYDIDALAVMRPEAMSHIRHISGPMNLKMERSSF